MSQKTKWEERRKKTTRLYILYINVYHSFIHLFICMYDLLERQQVNTCMPLYTHVNDTHLIWYGDVQYQRTIYTHSAIQCKPILCWEFSVGVSVGRSDKRTNSRTFESRLCADTKLSATTKKKEKKWFKTQVNTSTHTKCIIHSLCMPKYIYIVKMVMELEGWKIPWMNIWNLYRRTHARPHPTQHEKWGASNVKNPWITAFEWKIYNLKKKLEGKNSL